MEKVVDFTMTKLFQLAEYVCAKCSFLVKEPAAIPVLVRQELTPTIRFEKEEQLVEGDLFKQ